MFPSSLSTRTLTTVAPKPKKLRTTIVLVSALPARSEKQSTMYDCRETTAAEMPKQKMTMLTSAKIQCWRCNDV